MLLLLFPLTSAWAQVGIGTTNPHPSAALQVESTTGAFVPPRMSGTEINNIPTPLAGAVVYNSTDNAYVFFDGSSWIRLVDDQLPAIILEREFTSPNTVINGSESSYTAFPLTDTHRITPALPLVYDVVGNGTVEVQDAGVYQVTAGYAVNSVDDDNHKFIIGCFVNGTLQGYLNRGNLKYPNGTTDDFGTTGVITLNLAAGDDVSVEYVFGDSGNSNEADYFRMSIVKF